MWVIFCGLDGPTKFCLPWSKIKGTYKSDWGLARNGQNPAQRPKNVSPSGRTTTYPKTKVIQSYTRIWKYRGLMIPLSWVRPSQKMGVNTKMLPFGCPVMRATKNWTISEKNRFLAKNCIFCPKFCMFLRYTYETPIFQLGRTCLNRIICPPYPEVTAFARIVNGNIDNMHLMTSENRKSNF